jgi:Cell division protein FtsI/penicillin-binding protein 2
MIVVKKMLRQVVSNGTWVEANIAGWEIAGKTGTAQKYIKGKYSESKFISNFVGFFPLNEPQILRAIILEEPEAPMHWGGQGAAVAFNRIINRIINMDDSIRPPEKKQNAFANNQYKALLERETFSNQLPISLSTKASPNNIKSPNLSGKSLKKAKEIINRTGLKIKIEGSGRVVSQRPEPGTILRPREICLVKLK